ncbi:hypothetical protein C474_19949 [Halogeometricum pallidum JCM 14848]|uniref:Uncharacterized protein n=1 Tax=Halogeometricum pallidum JCM 14848 TaxID=1227487 RepID=M0CTB9_HALPD|nr:hypothetical protein [Halogeometricum pallidum]ELZ26456.1 hypothetical protein C474_19949 [Halogeometricum pallidum JCM 14848]
MSTTRCSRCSTVVPETRFCLNCRATLDAVGIPDRHPELTSHLSDVAAKADHESVTFETLRSKHDRYDRPLGAYLFEDERPRFVLTVDELAVDGPDDETWSVNPGFRKRGHALVSDRRVVVVSPSDRGDQVGAFSFDDVVGVETGSSWLTDTLSLELADGSTATLSVAAPDELDAVADRMRELAHSVHSSASRAVGFRRDLDAAVADATDAETALRAAADLFADRDGESGADRFVAEADSAEELFALLSDSTLVGPSPSRRADEKNEGGTTASGEDGTPADELVGRLPTARAPRLDARPLGRNLKRAFREGDPKEAGKWAIGAGIAGFSLAASLPFSTAAGLGAIALGGAATGAYASANPDSAAARIDPLEMAVGARTRGRRWDREGGPGGAAAGNLLGAAEHVFDRTNPPAEYAHWYANVDPEAILRGAEIGARAADASSEVGNRTTGALLGGGFGLAYGYSGLDADDGELEELLDDDDLRSVLPSEDVLGGVEDGVGGEAFVESAAEPAVESDAEDAADGGGTGDGDGGDDSTGDGDGSPSRDGSGE